MLDRAQLLYEMQHLGNNLFLDLSSVLEIARLAWSRLSADPTFVHCVQQLKSPWSVPLWTGSVDKIISVSPFQDEYSVLAVDGSQIYPDKHQGTSCSLINIGTFLLTYSQTESRVATSSKPYVIYDRAVAAPCELTPDWINCKRQELEFAHGYYLMHELKDMVTMPTLFLCDGSLIFWHLESKDADLKNFFLDKYLGFLEKYYHEQILCAGYISLPKSKELVNLVRLWITQIEKEELSSDFDFLVDSTIARFFIEPSHRSIVFKNNSPITKLYPEHLQPYFFYLDVGNEIARIEIPAWIAWQDRLVDHISSLILDQCTKGDGYPVCLAESHEQAVVKGPDRDFFYVLLAKIGIDQKRSFAQSRKSFKKRVMGV